MRLHRGVVPAALAVACALDACTAFDRDEDATSASDDGGADVPDGAHEAAASDASDGGVDALDGRPPGAVLFDDFEVSCGPGDLSRATVEHVTDSGAFSGVGACRICLTATPEGYWHKSIPSADAGTYRFEARVKKLTAAAWLLRLSVADLDGGPDAPKYNNGDLGASWSLAQVFAEASTPSRLDIDVFVDGDAGDCYLVDDVAVIAE